MIWSSVKSPTWCVTLNEVHIAISVIDGGSFQNVNVYIWEMVAEMSTHVNYMGLGGQSRAKNGQRSLRMTPNKVGIKTLVKIQ